MPRIDVHHHFFPPTLDKSKSSQDVGFRTPPENLPWTPEISLRYMEACDVDFTMLSFPAISSGCLGDGNRTAARKMNLYVAEICRKHPTRFGFLATVPFLVDIEGVLEEIRYALDELGAHGVSLPSHYGDGPSAKYIGDEIYCPVWAELNRRRTVVFIHGSQTPSSTPHPHALLGIPIVEVPNETLKAAAHLVVTGSKRKYPDMKIILAHLGGSILSLAPRIAALSSYMGSALTPDQIIQDFKSFYYETALTAHETTLTALDSFVSPSQVLFGSDFPAVNIDTITWFSNNLEKHYADKPDILNMILYKNALNLFPKLHLDLEKEE